MNGIHNGSVSSGSITSRARSCATMAANKQPSAAMPMVARKTAAASSIESGVPKNSESAGSSTASHKTSSAAAASALPAKMAAAGADVRITCSRLDCSFSAANARPNATSPANTSASQSTPGAIAIDLISVHHVQSRSSAHHVSLAQLDGAVSKAGGQRLVVRREDDRPLLHHAREEL